MRWLLSYVRQALAGRFRQRPASVGAASHVLVAIANHYEPGWGGASVSLGMERMTSWVQGIEGLGDLRDRYGAPLKHTYFFPAEQYEPEYLDLLVPHCRRGFGEVEVHLHHGMDRPDTAGGLRAAVSGFLEQMARRHGWVVRDREGRTPCYAFVHGNWALGNSADGRFCGVDEEVSILRDTGCYLDVTMPSAPDPTQVDVINALYAPSLPLDRPAPHRKGTPLRVGNRLPEPIFFLIQGPLLLNWRRRVRGVPFPRTENGDLGAEYLPTVERFRLWVRAHVHVAGRPEWVFVKLHCHGLQERHLPFLVGDAVRRFLVELREETRRGGPQVHFVSAREMANVALAAVEGADGDPHEFRDYNWKLA